MLVAKGAIAAYYVTQLQETSPICPLNQSERGSMRAVPGGAKAVKRPRILSDIVAKDIVVSVLSAHSEIGSIRRVPLAVQILDFVFVPVENESQGPLVGAIARIALDSHFIHRILRLEDRRGSLSLRRSPQTISSCALPYPQSLMMHLQRFSRLRVIRRSNQHNDRGQVHP